jgi:hypothetical protein
MSIDAVSGNRWILHILRCTAKFDGGGSFKLPTNPL